ncbi:MAG: flagellar biosynthetic protein FliR [Verrucomicrobiota bacterium]|nr:flagellar biosynthetic protein FliR [Verrucomicrobiota bacterium]
MTSSFTATENYLSLLLSLPKLPPQTVLSLFFLTLARLLPIVSLAPFLGGRIVPRPIRVLFSLALLALFLPPALLAVPKTLVFTIGSLSGYLLKELLIGLILGFLSAIPFYIAEMGGSLIDFQRGASSLQVSDPTAQVQTGPIGLLNNFFLIALFYVLGGPFLYFEGIADSYRLFPSIGPSFFELNSPFWPQVMELAALMFRIAVQLSAPALIGILCTDLFLGIANRLAPQVQITFLGVALKSWVGIAIMAAAWMLMVKMMAGEAMQWFETLRTLTSS